MLVLFHPANIHPNIGLVRQIVKQLPYQPHDRDPEFRILNPSSGKEQIINELDIGNEVIIYNQGGHLDLATLAALKAASQSSELTQLQEDRVHIIAQRSPLLGGGFYLHRTFLPGGDKSLGRLIDVAQLPEFSCDSLAAG